MSGMLRGSNPSWKVPAGTVLVPWGAGEGFALAGKDVGAGAGRGVEFWNTLAGLGEALVAAKVVPMGAV